VQGLFSAVSLRREFGLLPGLADIGQSQRHRHVVGALRDAWSIQDPDGSFVERHWQPINSPMHDEDGRLTFLLHHVEDVTDQVVR
jgi:hypothetical protein